MSRARILADYVAGGTTAAEFDYMDGVTSNVQTQLDAKGDVTLTGTQTLTNKTLTTPNLGTPSAITLTNATFPSGHVIGRSSFQDEDSSQVTTSDSNYENTGLEVVHTTTASSTDSYIEYQFYSGMSYTTLINKRGQLDCCMTDSSDSTYSDGNSISTGAHCHFQKSPIAEMYYPVYWRALCGLETGMGVSSDKGTWNAGDTLYFRAFVRVDGGEFRVIHNNTQVTITVTEYRR